MCIPSRNKKFRATGASRLILLSSEFRIFGMSISQIGVESIVIFLRNGRKQQPERPCYSDVYMWMLRRVSLPRHNLKKTASNSSKRTLSETDFPEKNTSDSGPY